MDNAPLTAEAESARQTLQAFLEKNPDWMYYHEDCERDWEYVLGLLRKFPELAGCDFFSHDITRPIGLMINAKAPLPVIQEVYEMYPKALGRAMDRLPLKEAIDGNSGVDVVRFLLEEYPEAVTNRGRYDGVFPMGTLLKRLRNDSDYSTHEFGIDQVEQKAKVLVLADTFDWGKKNYCVSLVVWIRHAIIHSQTAQHVLEWLGHKAGQVHLSRKAQGKHFNIVFDFCSLTATQAPNMLTFLKAVKAELEDDAGCFQMRFGAGCDVGSAFLWDVLSESGTPFLGIEFNKCGLVWDTGTQDQGQESLWCHGRVQQITIRDCNSNLCDLLVGSAPGLGAAPHLKTLAFDGMEITRELVEQVLPSHTLEHILIENLDGHALDHAEVEEILMRPNCNSTAEIEYYQNRPDTDSEEPYEDDSDYDSDDSSQFKKDLRHWRLRKKLHFASLLKMGRAKLQQEGSLAVLLKLLSTLHGKTQYWKPQSDATNLTLIYAYLHENPGLWESCSPVPTDN